MEKTKEEMTEEFVSMSLRMRKIQDDVLNRYLRNKATIQWNLLETIKKLAKNCSSLDDFKKVLDKAIEDLTNLKLDRPFTYIEDIEYKFIKKIYRDVILKQGKEFDMMEKDLVFHWDNQEIVVEPITFDESYREE